MRREREALHSRNLGEIPAGPAYAPGAGTSGEGTVWLWRSATAYAPEGKGKWEGAAVSQGRRHIHRGSVVTLVSASQCDLNLFA